jgi:hypothetical protein
MRMHGQMDRRKDGWRDRDVTTLFATLERHLKVINLCRKLNTFRTVLVIQCPIYLSVKYMYASNTCQVCYMLELVNISDTVPNISAHGIWQQLICYTANAVIGLCGRMSKKNLRSTWPK